MIRYTSFFFATQPTLATNANTEHIKPVTQATTVFKMYRGLNAKCTGDLMQNVQGTSWKSAPCFFVRFYLKLKYTDKFYCQLPYQFALKSVTWTFKFFDTDRHYKANGRFSQVSCELVSFLNIFLKTELVHGEDIRIHCLEWAQAQHWLSKNHKWGPNWNQATDTIFKYILHNL